MRKAERDFAAAQLIESQQRRIAESELGTARIQVAEAEIAKVNQPQTEAIRAQQATIQSLEAQLRLAQLDQDRLQDLFNQGAISRQEVPTWGIGRVFATRASQHVLHVLRVLR